MLHLSHYLVPALVSFSLFLFHHAHAQSFLRRRDAVAGGFDLRILPFGDSITWGQASSDGNGYRKKLLERLSPGNHVEFVGTQKHGSMENNNMEGHQGFDIELFRERGMPDFTQQPNVVLLMLGTNNIFYNISFDQAPQLLGDLINVIVMACPHAAILVAEITPLRNPEMDEKRVKYNAAMPSIIDPIAAQGKQVSLTSMKEVTTEHINKWDKVHPTDEGYKLIAEAWYVAIVEAGLRGWIEAPMDVKEQDSGSIADMSAQQVNEDANTASQTISHVDEDHTGPMTSDSHESNDQSVQFLDEGKSEEASSKQDNKPNFNPDGDTLQQIYEEHEHVESTFSRGSTSGLDPIYVMLFGMSIAGAIFLSRNRRLRRL